MPRGDQNQWGELQDLWREAPVQPQVPELVRAHVQREQQRLYLLVLLESIMVAALLAWGSFELITAQNTLDVLRGAIVLSITVIAVMMSLTLQRGAWFPKGEDARSYLALSRRRVRLGWLAIRSSWLLFSLEIIVFASLDAAARFDVMDVRVAPTLVLVIFLAAFAAVLAGWSAWYARRLRRREAALDELVEMLDIQDQ